VQTESQAGGRRPIFEDMAQMPVASRAENFGARATVRVVGLFDHIAWRDGTEEAWPAGAGIKLRIRREQRQPAAGARVDAFELVVEEVAAELSFGAFATKDLVLLVGESASPFGVAQFEFRRFDWPDKFPVSIEDVNRDHFASPEIVRRLAWQASHLIAGSDPRGESAFLPTRRCRWPG